MRKILACCFAYSMITTCGYAQSFLQDVVYLKDGSILRGIIREQYPDSLVKIEIAGGNIIAVTAMQLQRVEYKIKSQPVRKIEQPRDTAHHPNQGYFNITETGVMPGSGYSYAYYAPQSGVGFTIHTINGYRFSPHLLIGAGIGMDIIQQPMLQLFGDARWELLNRKATPFAYVDGGYGVPLSGSMPDDYYQTRYKGGITSGLGIGMRFNFHYEGAFLVSVGYKVDKRTEYTVVGWPAYETENAYTYKRLALKVGLAF